MKIALISGFTLIELMIVMAIIGILVLIGIPSYQTYTRRAHYTEIVQSAAPYKIGVEECFITTGDVSSCDAGQYGIPIAITNPINLIARTSVTQGMITITPVEKYGIKATDTYILTPTIQDDSLLWNVSGGGIIAGYAHG